MKKFLILLICVNLFTISMSAQYKVDTKIETLGIFSDGDNAPFWLTNNKYGLGSTDNNKQYVRAQSIIRKQFSRDWTISGGLDLVGANGIESDFFIQQAFIDASFKNITLSIGMKERDVLFKNMNIFSGAMTLSNNARPIPQVEIITPKFLTLPYTNEWLQVKGILSYGTFTDNTFKVKYAGDANYAKNVLYHRKAGFLKIEKQTPWNIVLGLEMDTQFGGDFYSKGVHTSSSPSKLIDFFKILIPMSGGSDSNITDQVNIVGNIYGSSHFIFNYNFEKYTAKAYYEHFYEDHSGLFFKNMPDGIYGVELNTKRKALISSLVLEYVHAKNQSGPFLWDQREEIPVQVSAGDNYYNHGDYISLANYGFTIGSPLLTSPIYNKGTSLRVKHSRIAAYHLGIGGNLSNEFDYRLLFTYSKSWGTPFIPTRNIKEQLSTMIECSYSPYKFKGWTLSSALALDRSTMIGDNFGIQLKLSKTFNSRF